MKNEERIFVIGDLLGNKKGLIEILHEIQYRPNADKLIFLGNYIGLWDDCFDLVEFLMILQNFGNCVFLRGANDFKFTQGFFTRDNYQYYEFCETNWYSDYCLSYAEQNDSLGLLDHERFFKSLKYYHIEKKLITTKLTHATYNIKAKHFAFVSSGWNVRQNVSLDTSFEKRGGLSMMYDKKLWDYATELDEYSLPHTPNVTEMYNEIYIGSHTIYNYNSPSNPTGLPRPTKRSNVTCMNTGNSLNGVVSAIQIETGEKFVSQRSNLLYPEEYRNRLNELVNGY